MPVPVPLNARALGARIIVALKRITTEAMLLYMCLRFTSVAKILDSLLHLCLILRYVYVKSNNVVVATMPLDVQM